MKIGTKLQFEIPDKCPENCTLEPEAFYQGCTCCRCPIFSCNEGTTEEDKMYLPLVPANHFRDDWAEEWEKFFKGEVKFPILKL